MSGGLNWNFKYPGGFARVSAGFTWAPGGFGVGVDRAPPGLSGRL